MSPFGGIVSRVSKDVLAKGRGTDSACRGHLDFERGVILREMEEVEKTTEEATMGHFFFSAVALLSYCP